MNFLGGITQYCSNAAFLRLLFPEKPKRIFKQYSSDLNRIANLVEDRLNSQLSDTKRERLIQEDLVNSQISDALPSFNLQRARLIDCDDGTSILEFYDTDFEYKNEDEMDTWLQDNSNSNSSEHRVFEYDEKKRLWFKPFKRSRSEFKDEKDLDRFLLQYPNIDIWEIKQNGTPPIIYKLLCQDGNGKATIDTFDSTRALFEKIAEGVGRLWKMVDLKKDLTIYMLAQVNDRWSKHRLSFVSRNKEDLSYIMKPDQPSRLYPKGIKGLVVNLLFLGAGCVAGGYLARSIFNLTPYSPYSPNAYSDIRSDMMKNARVTHHIASQIGIVDRVIPFAICTILTGGRSENPVVRAASAFACSFFSPFSGSAAQPSSPPTQTSSPSTGGIYFGQQFNLNVSSVLNPSSSNGPVGYSYSNLPTFLNLNSSPSTVINYFGSFGDGLAGADKNGNFLFTFGGNNSGTEIFTVNPITIVTFGGIAATVSDGVLDFNRTVVYLAYGKYGFRIGAFSLIAGNFGFSGIIPANKSVNAVALDANTNRVWFTDDNALRLANVSNLNSPTAITSFKENQTIMDIAVGNNIVYIWTPAGMRILDVSNPSAPISQSFINFTSPSSGRFSCQNGVCYIPETSGKVGILNVTDPTNPQFISSYTPQGNAYSALIDNLLIVSTNNNTVEIVNVTNPTSPQRLMSIETPYHPYRAFFDGNDIFISTTNGTLQYALNQAKIFGTPGPGDQGNYTFYINTVSLATGQVIDSVPVTIDVLGYPPSIPPPMQPPQAVATPTSIPNNPVPPVTPPQVPQAAPLTLSTPSNTTAAAPISNNVVTPSSPNGLSVGAIAGIAVGGVVILAGVAVIIVVVRRRKVKVASKASQLRLPSQIVSKTTIATIGGRFAELPWDEKERKECFESTGIVVPVLKWDEEQRKEVVNDNGFIGKGVNGEAYVGWDNHDSNYVVIKKVTDTSKFEQSKKEAELQIEAYGAGVAQILAYIQDDKKNILFIFLEVAGLRDLKYVNKRIAKVNPDQRELYATYVAFDILTALKTLQKKGLGHFDIKGSNILVKKDGTALISDFGSAMRFKEIDEVLPYCDSECKSPKQIDQKTISTEEDLWGAGLAILGLLLGKETKYNQKFQKQGGNFGQYMQKELASIQQLRNPTPGSIWEVVSILLDIEPSSGNLSRALKAKCFAALDPDTKEGLFAKLIPDFNTNLEDSNSLENPANLGSLQSGTSSGLTNLVELSVIPDSEQPTYLNAASQSSSQTSYVNTPTRPSGTHYETNSTKSGPIYQKVRLTKK